MKLHHMIAAATLALASAAHAQPGGAGVGAPTATAAAATADGEVRKVDKAQGKVTLKHGPIASLDMPAMTMVFKLADPKLLDTVKEGDKVRFAAERINGAITVTRMEVAR